MAKWIWAINAEGDQRQKLNMAHVVDITIHHDQGDPVNDYFHVYANTVKSTYRLATFTSEGRAKDFVDSVTA